MARLPQVGGDDGNWGAILNDFLSQSLDSDGNLKPSSVDASQLKPSAVTNAALAPATIAEDRLTSSVRAKLNNAASEDYVDNAISQLPPAPVQSVNGQTGNVTVTVNKSDIGLGSVDNTSDNAKPLSAATQTALDGKVNTTASTDNRVARFDGTNGQVQNSAVMIDDSGNLYLSAATSGTRRSLSGNGGNLSFGQNGINLNSTNETAINFDVGSAGTGVFSVYKGATNQNGTKLAEIDNSGRFKINTSSNLAKLNVLADNTSTEYIALFTEAGTTPEASAVAGGMGRMVSVQGLNGASYMARDVTADIEFNMGTSNVGRVFAGSATAHDFELRTNNSSRFFIQNSNGNIGIGNTSPTQRLTVTGNITSTGTVNGRDISADAVKVETYGMGTVVHGATAATARPTGFGCITWIGSVAPTNALTNDIWMYKA